jgi:hypothetical protein
MVTLPDCFSSTTKVRCPLCQAEYPLSEVLELVPPTLILVPDAEVLPSPVTTAAPLSGLVPEPFFSEEPTITPPVEDVTEEVVQEVEELPVADAAVEMTDKSSIEQRWEDFANESEELAIDAEDIPIDFEEQATESEPIPLEEKKPLTADEIAEEAFAVEVPEETSSRESMDDFALDFAEHLAESDSHPEESEELELVESLTEPEEIQDFAFNSSKATPVNGKPSEPALINNAAPGRPVAPARTKPLVKPLPMPRRRKKRGPVRLVFEVVFGGCLSLVIAYYGVWWIRGESAGWPRFDWVPFLPEPHVARAPNTPAVPAAIPKDVPSNDTPDAATQASVPPVDQVDNTEAVTKSEAPVENTPVTTPPPEIETKKPVTPEPPAIPPMPKIGPRPPAVFTSLDLDSAIDDVTVAFFSKAGGKVNAESYPAFCRLAEVDTYIAADKLLPAQQRTVVEFLVNIAKDPKQIAEIERLVTAALKNPGERPGGILLAGKAGDVASRNGMYGTVIRLAGSGENVSVLSVKPFDFKKDDAVLLVGGMVVKPAENIAGYSGKRPLVVWFGTAVPIPAADDAK